MMDTASALQEIRGVGSGHDWTRVYANLTRQLKSRIDQDEISEVGRIFELREQLLKKLEQVLKQDPGLGADEEFFQTLDIIRGIEKECMSQLQNKMNHTRKQLTNLKRIKNSKRLGNKDQNVVSRFVDLKR